MSRRTLTTAARIALPGVAGLLLLGSSFGPRFTDPATRHPVPVESARETGAVRGASISAPYYSQLDGSIYEGSNCGVASIAMAMGVWGHAESLLDLREWVNDYTGVWDPDAGLGWETLAAALNARGFSADGLYAGGGYRAWSVDDLLVETRAGRPVIVLAHWQSLPGHADLSPEAGDHYVVFLGMTDDGNIIYHDSSLPGGAYRVTDRSTFENAWANTWAGANRTAMSVVSAER
jgi:hypothetical protein